MPELPEVETICRVLRALVPGRKIAGVEVRERRLRYPLDPEFGSELQGRRILGVERRGKYILIDLEEDRVWISHLGMSGKLICVPGTRPREKHDHVVVRLEGGMELRYHDPRRFGLLLALPRVAIDSMPPLKSLGLDPLGRGFSGAYLHGLARRSRRRIRDLLMDQRVLAGLGNIYANEILFRARVRPATRAWRVGRERLERIARAAPRVLQEAIRWRGTSFSDYRDGRDRRGEFQKRLSVYGREGQPCRRCGSLIKKALLGQRGAFYCPSCQK